MPKQELDGAEVFNLSLSIVGLVMNSGPMLIQELSNHFGVSEKAIQRAVQAISNSEDLQRYETHFYFDFDALEKGEVAFSQGQGSLTEAPTLSKKQATALGAGLDYLASLPEFDSNPDLAHLRQALGGAVTSVRNERFEPQQQHLTLLRRAISERKVITCEYLNQLGERTNRDIDPLRIDFVGKRHYLRGWCHKNKAVRSFRVDRILNVSMTNLPVSAKSLEAEIPEDVFGAGLDQIKIKIEADSTASEIFWNFPLLGEPTFENGRWVGEIRVGGLKGLARHIARYGGRVRVISPSIAREAVRAFALKALGETEVAE